MPRLILADLIANARVWLGALAVVIATGFVAAFAACFIQTGNAAGGEVQQSLSSLGGVVIAFTSITALIVLGSSAKLTVALQQRGYALWQLVGIRPAFVGLIVLGQLLIVAVVGALAGCLIALPLLQPSFDALFRTWDAMHGVEVHFDLVSVLWLTVGIAVTVLIGGLRGARRASRVRPIQALREPDPPRVRMGWLRWLLSAATLAGIVGMSVGLQSESFTAVSGQSPFLAALLCAPLAALGPILFPGVLRAWTALIPRRVFASWYLARHSARYRLSQSSAAISPLMVAITLTGGLYTSVAILGSAAHRAGETGSYGIAFEGVVVLLGGPLLLSGVGAAATVFMSGRAREREFALVQAAGSTHATIIVMAVWEAVIYAVTAAILAAAAILVSGLILAPALEVSPLYAIAPPAMVAAGGLVLLLAATVIPTAVALRHRIPRTLAVE